MRLFHISDVLSITTGRLVSRRHMDGLYDILNFLTGDSLFTHQLPRAMRECEPWLRVQFPKLMADYPGIKQAMINLDSQMRDSDTREMRARLSERFVEGIRLLNGLPEMLSVYELGADMHTRIDPVKELEAMVGKGRVISVVIDD